MKLKSLFLPLIAVSCITYSAISIANTQPTPVLTDPHNAPPAASFQHAVAASGLVEPSSEMISLSAPLPGVVEAILVKVGQQVKRGQELVKLDTRALEALLAERKADAQVQNSRLVKAEAEMKMVSVQLEEAKRLLANADKLREAKAISQDELINREAKHESLTASLASVEADVGVAKAQLVLAAAATHAAEVDIERSVIKAPIDATVLQIKIRPGEQASIDAGLQPWMILGQTTPLYVRVDVDEHEAWRVKPAAAASVQVRGNAKLATTMRFVREEPLVVPKKSFTGASTERVDTRVYQLIYQIEPNAVKFLPGQQVDVFLEALSE